jgi:hypothetical protein
MDAKNTEKLQEIIAGFPEVSLVYLFGSQVNLKLFGEYIRQWMLE